MRTVLDTSVLIAALRSGHGAAAEVVRLLLTGEFALLMDFKLACEYREVSLRPDQLRASDKTSEQVSVFLDALEAIAQPVFVAFRHRPLSRDAADDMVLDVAINGNADVIVTNNVKHFRSAAKEFNIEVLLPAELLASLRRKR